MTDMYDDPKILTISIAAYNAGASLQRTLASLECADDVFRCLDIIIVDDGSTDDTRMIAESFAADHPGSARVISKPNGGYGSTVNESVSEARGTYFRLLDGDDTADRAGLEGLVRYLGSFQGGAMGAPDLVISPFYYDFTGEDRQQLCDRHSGLQSMPVMLEEADIDDGLMMFELCVRTDVLRKSAVRLTGNCYYTDNEYVMAAELYASTAVRYPLPVYRYSVGVPGQSMSIEGRRRHYDDKIRASWGVFGIYDRYCCSGRGEDISGTRKLITDKLLSTMAREVYVSLMIQEDPAAFRNVLQDYDRELEEKWPHIYKVSCDSRLVTAARRAGRKTYPLLCRHVLRSETSRMHEKHEGSLLMIAEYIAAACMIVQCRTVYMHLQDYGMMVNRGVWVIMMAALLTCVICSGRGYNRLKGSETFRSSAADSAVKTAAVCIGIAVYAAVFIIVNPVNQLRVIRCAGAVMMMTALIRSSGGSRSACRILCRFRDLMVIIAAVSLMGWILITVLKILPFTGTVYMDWTKTGGYVEIPAFCGIYFETQPTDWALVSARNSGIFVEGPMAGCAYSIALLIEYYFAGPDVIDPGSHQGTSGGRLIRIILLAAAVLSTLSLISYATLILISLASLISSAGAGRQSGSTYTRAAAAVLAAGAALLAVFIYRKLQLLSGNVRFNDFVVGFNAWLAHPFFGGGFESLEYLQQFMPEWRSFDTGFSNSPMEILAQGGIYLAAPYIYAFFSSLADPVKRRDIRMPAFVLIFAYIFTFTVIPYQYITFFVLIWMYDQAHERNIR